MIQTDTVIIGAGPVGLFQLFQLGLLGLKAHVVDVLPEAGGQCVALYPDKPIYDVPGLPVCTGRALTDQLMQQARPFIAHGANGEPANLHFGTQVHSVTATDDGFVIGTASGLMLQTASVFVAAGAGAFVPKALAIPGLPPEPGGQPGNLHYHLPAEAQSAPWAGQHLVIAGGGDEALSAVISVLQSPAAQQPRQITLLHRRDQFQAEPALEAQVRTLIGQGQVSLALGVVQGAQRHDDARLQSLSLLTADGQPVDLPLDHLLVRQGLSPKLGPLAEWGLQLDRKQVVVDPGSFASSVQGVYAVGDISTYPGKKRLIVCGFHEATLAAHDAHRRLRPDAPQHLQYTTTSALLHQRLGLN